MLRKAGDRGKWGRARTPTLEEPNGNDIRLDEPDWVKKKRKVPYCHAIIFKCPGPDANVMDNGHYKPSVTMIDEFSADCAKMIGQPGYALEKYSQA
ncbi:hypothetical protein Z517_09238 [Fonsecaea pedrosoi CBS 271.37]|uniref:Uncharacterized protein n=1 Tax=Fonsecaea pedrosoi CBS 271.37 TaxID=1442368 RepID=A0A0D2GWQ4_9EURO|nr:uncharacterized protein Z517_09238 [Fonsecaea pedrosoi CBS 271.37]KIW76794.1 hypothetical protein Z517_09238 [Fonsecaea pedrosoi CBS 271.37]